MKAVLSDRIYMEVLPHTQKKIDDELTYSIPSFKFNDPPFIIKNMALIKQGLIKTIDPSSGHYRPTKRNYCNFLTFLKYNGIDITNIKLYNSNGGKWNVDKHCEDTNEFTTYI